MTKVKGTIILSRVEFLRAQGALERVQAALSEADVQQLHGVFPSGWYDLGFNERLDASIAAVLSPHDRRQPFIAMGRASADANLSGHHAAFVDPNDPHRLLSAASRIYRLYYDTGSREYEKTSATSAVLRTKDAPAATAEDCLTVIGWHERAIELSGGRGVQVAERQCRAQGGAWCEYHCSWE